MRHKQKELKVKSRKLKVLGVATLLTFAFSLSSVSAQESVNATGGNASGSGGSVSYSVGQIVYQTNSGTNGEVAEGVQQPYEIFSVGIKETELNISLSAFPNPTIDNLTLQISDYNNEKLSYQLFDMQGKLLKNGQIMAEQTQINMSTLPTATYFVNVVNQENKKVYHVKSNQVCAKQFNVVQSFKIIKQ